VRLIATPFFHIFAISTLSVLLLYSKPPTYTSLSYTYTDVAPAYLVPSVSLVRAPFFQITALNSVVETSHPAAYTSFSDTKSEFTLDWNPPETVVPPPFFHIFASRPSMPPTYTSLPETNKAFALALTAPVVRLVAMSFFPTFAMYAFPASSSPA